MGFIYGKPLSIEQIFSKFDKNNDGKIDGKEAEANKEPKTNSIFNDFQVEEGMTLEEFEKINLDRYKQYEAIATEHFEPADENFKKPPYIA